MVEVPIVGVRRDLRGTVRRRVGGAGGPAAERAAIGWAFAAFAGAMILSLTYAGLIEATDADWLRAECAEQIPKEVRDTRMLLAIASVTVIAFAPVCEELFFRGFMFPGLARGWGLVAGIIVSGLLFASAHLLYKSFIPIAGVGMVFAYAYYRSRNIFSTMAAHMAFNSLSIAAIAAGSCNAAVIGVLHDGGAMSRIGPMFARAKAAGDRLHAVHDGGISGPRNERRDGEGDGRRGGGRHRAGDPVQRPAGGRADDPAVVIPGAAGRNDTGGRD